MYRFEASSGTIRACPIKQLCNGVQTGNTQIQQKFGTTKYKMYQWIFIIQSLRH